MFSVKSRHDPFIAIWQGHVIKINNNYTPPHTLQLLAQTDWPHTTQFRVTIQSRQRCTAILIIECVNVKTGDAKKKKKVTCPRRIRYQPDRNALTANFSSVQECKNAQVI